jgi:hypothetical protein
MASAGYHGIVLNVGSTVSCDRPSCVRKVCYSFPVAAASSRSVRLKYALAISYDDLFHKISINLNVYR